MSRIPSTTHDQTYTTDRHYHRHTNDISQFGTTRTTKRNAYARNVVRTDNKCHRHPDGVTRRRILKNKFPENARWYTEGLRSQ